MIIVTGANGHLGRGVVNRLLQLVPATQIAVTVRDVAKAADLASQGVHVRHGDFDAPETLAEGFAGAERLLLISTDVVGEARVQQHRNAVDAAKAAGVQHLVYTSVTNPDPASPFVAAASHAATEAYIRQSEIPFTILRNTIYMEILPMLVGAAFAGGPIEAPADGPVAYATRADLAEGTANLLASGGHLNEVLELNGAEALDLERAAQIVSELLGRPVERRVVSNEAYREQLVANGFPAPGADMFLGIFAALHQQRFATVHPDLETLLGRPPVTAAAFLQQAR
jgi:NAD(P)H dehydrogenase (quinone)